jgi:hypothetical protein
MLLSLAEEDNGIGGSAMVLEIMGDKLVTQVRELSLAKSDQNT